MTGRRRDRTLLIYSLKVEDRNTEALLGYVVNINPWGAMLMASHPRTETGPIDVRVHLPRNAMGGEFLDVVGEIRWCRSSGEQRFLIGVRFLHKDAAAEQHIAELMERFYQTEGDDEHDDPYMQNLDPTTL